LCWQQTKHQYHHKKKWCATTNQETLLDNYGCQDFQSKQSFQSYRQLKEFIDGWVLEKDNVSLNTQQLFTMPMYSTYKGPIVSLDQTG
jgi:hypothetical protein